MSAPVHVIEAAASAAFDQYHAALAALALPKASQLDLFDPAADRVREWRRIWLACERELGARLGSIGQ